MARFDVFETSGGTLAVTCQSSLFDHLDVRFVVPLVPLDEAPNAIQRLNPEIEFEGRRYLAFPQWASGMPLKELRRCVGNVEAEGLRLLDSLDMLISGA
jgi:toxin CcdB